ncbi:hypothetical protein PAMP_001416 [Pampus punctatissimus]
MASTTVDVLPTGRRTFSSIPDLFFIPEFVFGGLVWILVACTYVNPSNPIGWVMFVSIFCFIGTTLWFFIFLCGANQSSIWPSLDVFYHFVAVILYLSASVILAYITVLRGSSVFLPQDEVTHLCVSVCICVCVCVCVCFQVMSYLATLLYFLHAIFSAIRWKRS